MFPEWIQPLFLISCPEGPHRAGLPSGWRTTPPHPPPPTSDVLADTVHPLDRPTQVHPNLQGLPAGMSPGFGPACLQVTSGLHTRCCSLLGEVQSLSWPSFLSLSLLSLSLSSYSQTLCLPVCLPSSLQRTFLKRQKKGKESSPGSDHLAALGFLPAECRALRCDHVASQLRRLWLQSSSYPGVPRN